MKTKKKANTEIRDYAKRKDVYLWELAAKFGIRNAEQFSKRLRFEFSPEDKALAFQYIDEIASERR